ncbi:uracil-dna glycosylase [Diaporthe amygdali]|uniref:uracil-dna glycosylase n=1 Tax=Phomopsis amygdali TaxID=1214568 RepID=UPI0022FDFEAB|nr:uracil-dna glycosylase [Diaporthe amygdali]KAJ0122278.1 uracil-dna glycosylase [Diaporthe amygdali]
MSSVKRKATGQAAGSDPKKPKQNASITSFFGAPKAVPSTGAGVKSSLNGGSAPSAAVPEPAAAKFDKAKWVATLTEEQKQLLQLEIDTLDPSWLAHLKGEIVTKEFLDLKRFLDREASAGKKIFPPREDIYSWSRHTPFSNVKVVVVGQDPYHNVGQAHGLAFSVRAPTPAPPSLKNMYTCLKNDYPSFAPPPNRGGLLTPWADRGVLLLNTCLTVRAHEANSHANRGWERFTQKVIDLVAARRTSGVVFMAWGTPAGKRVMKVDKKRHLVLTSVHPSPLSAARGFFTCGHFKKANEWLLTRYGNDGEIDWSLGKHDTPTTTAGMAAVAAKKETLEDDVDDDWEAEAAAAIVDAESKANAMGPPPTPSPRKTEAQVETPDSTEKTKKIGIGKENEQIDIPA